MKLSNEYKRDLINLACKIGRKNNFNSIEMLKSFANSKNEINKINLITLLTEIKLSLSFNEQYIMAKNVQTMINSIK